MLVVITGGAGSGKTLYAETLLRNLCPDIKEPQLIRQYMILRNLHLEGEHVLLECIPDLLNQKITEYNPASEVGVAESVFEDIMYAYRQSQNMVVATEDMFADVVMDSGIKKYIEEMGRLNQLLVSQADAFAEVVYEIPLFYKGADRIRI